MRVGIAPSSAVPTPDPASAPVPAPTPAPIADGVAHPLDPRLIALDRTVGWIATGGISFGLLIALVIFLLAHSAPGWAAVALAALWAAATLALGWFSYQWPTVEHRHASYRVDAQGIEIRRGVIWRRVINVPRSRVQHTDVSQGPLERGHGLGTLAIHTAGTDHARVDLHGLDHATALRIRDHLLPQDYADAV